MHGDDFGALAVKKDSPLKSAKDLEGKTVAVNTLKNILDTSVARVGAQGRRRPVAR